MARYGVDETRLAMTRAGHVSGRPMCRRRARGVPEDLGLEDSAGDPRRVARRLLPVRPGAVPRRADWVTSPPIGNACPGPSVRVLRNVEDAALSGGDADVRGVLDDGRQPVRNDPRRMLPAGDPLRAAPGQVVRHRRLHRAVLAGARPVRVALDDFYSGVRGIGAADAVRVAWFAVDLAVFVLAISVVAMATASFRRTVGSGIVTAVMSFILLALMTMLPFDLVPPDWSLRYLLLPAPGTRGAHADGRRLTVPPARVPHVLPRGRPGHTAALRGARGRVLQ